MTLIDILRLGILIGAIGKAIELGSRFGAFGAVIGALIGAALVALLQVILVLFGLFLTTRRAVDPPPPQLLVSANTEEAPQASWREVHPAWFVPVAFGMFSIVGAIGSIIGGKVSFLWNCLGLAVVTVLILALGALALITLYCLDHLLAMPANAVASKMEQKRNRQGVNQ